MTLMGRANWWAPTSLRRLHGRIGLSEYDGGSGADDAAAPKPVAVPV